MQVENHPGEISSQLQSGGDVTETTQVENAQENGSHRTVVPAKLPPHSQAAIAQRLNDIPEKPIAGVYRLISRGEIL